MGVPGLMMWESFRAQISEFAASNEWRTNSTVCEAGAEVRGSTLLRAFQILVLTQSDSGQPLWRDRLVSAPTLTGCYRKPSVSSQE